MKNIHILTLAGLLLLPFAIFQSFLNFQIVAEITVTLAFLLVFIETKKITSPFQHFALIFISILLGFICDQHTKGFPIMTIAAFVAVAGFITRMVFIKVFSYAQFRYFEFSASIIVLLLILLKLYLNPTKYLYFAPVYTLLVFSIIFTLTILQNSIMVKKQRAGNNKSNIGKKAPDFLLPDQNGNGVRLSDYNGKRTILLIFVRGDWCPYCHMIMRTYMRESHKFKEKDIFLIAIGPDPVGINREMAKKLGLEYEVLSDEKMKTAEEYGILLPDFELPGSTEHEEGMPLPASFLIDKNGIILYTSRNDKVGEFLDPRLIFPIVESLN